MKVFILFAMLFCHIVDDFYLQGILAKMKQKQWWKENAPEEIYKNDYKVALIVHAMSWSFMILLPLAVYTLYIHDHGTFLYVNYPLYFIWNTIMHAWIDNKKANKHEINLIIDQIWHTVQIIITYAWYILIYS